MTTQSGAATRHVEGITSLISIALAVVALVLAPWPGLWSSEQLQSNGLWIVLWAALEGAFLVPLLPGLLSGAPAVVRSTMRDGQIGVAGRALAWLAAGAGLALGGLSLLTLPAYALALVALLVALPLAIGWGPFGMIPGHARSAAERAIEPAAAALVQRARTTRNLILIVVMLALALPIGSLPLPAGWALLLGAVLLVLFLLRRQRSVWPRQTLPAAMRFAWGRALPLAVAAIIYVVILSWA